MQVQKLATEGTQESQCESHWNLLPFNGPWLARPLGELAVSQEAWNGWGLPNPCSLKIQCSRICQGTHLPTVLLVENRTLDFPG